MVSAMSAFQIFAMPIRLIRKYPVVKTMVSYLCINVAADCSEQVLIKKRTRETYDLAKTVRIASVGCLLIAPMLYNWIRFIDRKIPGKNVVSVLKKVLCHSSLFAPLAISTFHITLNILEGKSDLTAEWKEKFLKTWTTGLMYWPFIQSVNFAFVPPHLKTSVYMPMASFVWMNFMCFMKDKKISADTKEQDTPTAAKSILAGKAQIQAKVIDTPCKN